MRAGNKDKRQSLKVPCVLPSSLPPIFAEWDPVIFCNSNNDTSTSFLGLGKLEDFQKHDTGGVLSFLKTFLYPVDDWIFGSISYDLKNEIEKLTSRNPDIIGFPVAHFFKPEIVICFRNGLAIAYFFEDITKVALVKSLLKTLQAPVSYTDEQNAQLAIRARTSRQNYLENVKSLQQHIQLGDIYEVNYCQEFFAEEIKIDPILTYNILNKISPMPFSAYYRNGPAHLICASPELFLKKENRKVISRPIKGTIRRGKDEIEDELLKKELRSSAKEKGENVMIVDLVRNDLSRIAVPGSVQVDELFGIYTFSGLHQMISTVSSVLRPEADIVDLLTAAFPMGSMTGAPKISAMKLIDLHEEFRRGLFSGSIGFITPSGDCDFNVVIRSILYNEAKNYLSLPAGGAITHRSDPLSEYEESLLKVKYILKALGTSASYFA